MVEFRAGLKLFAVLGVLVLRPAGASDFCGLAEAPPVWLDPASSKILVETPSSISSDDATATSTRAVSFGLSSLSLADVAQPVAQYPVTYLLDGEPSQNSVDLIPGGTRFSIALPPGASFLEAGALSRDWVDFEPLACAETASTVQCDAPPDKDVWFPVTIAVEYESAGLQTLSVSMEAPDGTTIDGVSVVAVDSEVLPHDAEPVVVDVLFLHDPAIADVFPGSKLRTEFDSWIAFANHSLKESGVKIILRNVGIDEFAVDPALQYFEALNAVRTSDFYDLRRQQTGADIGIYYKRKTRTESCGQASLGLPGSLITRNSNSMALVQEDLRECGAPSQTFLHEIGHVMGLGHEVDVPRYAAPRGYWTFARGHFEESGQHPNESRRGTIMSGNTTNRLSNPDVTCPTGLPCGVPIGDPKQAHAAKALNALRWAIRDTNASNVDPLASDVGIWLRGLPSSDDTIRVRAELQNYSSIAQSNVTFELSIPDGWALSGTEPAGACVPVSGDSDYGCELQSLAAFGSGSVDFRFTPGEQFTPAFSAKLLQADAFSYNDQSQYDPRYNLRVATQLLDLSDDPNSSFAGRFDVHLSSHVHSNPTVSLGLDFDSNISFWTFPSIRVQSGYDFQMGRPEWEFVGCNSGPTANGYEVRCLENRPLPIWNESYELPPFENRSIASFTFENGSPVEEPELVIETEYPLALPEPDLVVSKSADPSSLGEPGGRVNFALQVRNNVDSALSVDTMVDDVHGNLDGQGDCATGASIAPGDSYQCAYEVELSGDAGEVFESTTTATASDAQGNQYVAIGEASVSIDDVIPEPGVEKTVTPALVNEPGETVTFTVRVENGPREPISLQALSDDVHGDLQGRGSCDLPQSIPEGGSYQCTYTALAQGNVGQDEVSTVTATVADNEGNLVDASGSATVVFSDVLPSIEVEKTATPQTVPQPGGAVSFWLEIRNTSVEPVELTDLIDDVYGDLNGQGSCLLPASLSSGDSFACEFAADVMGVVGSSETSTVTATAVDDEANTVLGSASATVEIVRPEADLSVRIEDSADPIQAGGSVVLSVEAFNNGPDTASEVGIRLALPAGFELSSSTGCSEDPNGVPVCSIGELEAGSSRAVTFSVASDLGLDGMAVFEATVSSPIIVEVNPGDERSVEMTDILGDDVIFRDSFQSRN